MRRRFVSPPIALALVVAGGLIVAGCGSANGGGSSANAADRAFVRQMVPHHMMAVQMAQTAQGQGTHPQIKSLAGSIISDQRAEIVQMTPMAQKLGVNPDAMPAGGHMSDSMMGDAQALGLSMDQTGMSMNMDSLNSARPFDRAFIDMMTPHHQGAVRMAQAELSKGKDPQLRALAQRIIGAQTREIGEMSLWRSQWYGAGAGAHAGAGHMP